MSLSGGHPLCKGIDRLSVDRSWHIEREETLDPTPFLRHAPVAVAIE